MLKKREKNKASESFMAAALSLFKPHKKRKFPASARSGLNDRRPAKEDIYEWKDLLKRRRGYIFAAKVIQRILNMLKKTWERQRSKEKVFQHL